MSAIFMQVKPKADRWYKEPWLLLVVGGPAIVVCASLFTGFLAWRGADKVIAEDYYKQGLMINKDIQRDARARALQLTSAITLDSSGRVLMQLSGNGVLPDTVQLSLANAAANATSVNELVRRLPLKQIVPGSYEGHLPAQSSSSFNQVKLFHAKLETSEWRLTGDWFNPEQKPLQLQAAK
ncbi:FixH family protein [Undibacterium sp. RuTC16W]|uniref:FixH family protein n=1 Tax=Undibacterium sp. RuTC16W TaxID=3413048 RepID=UPI003BF10C19